MSMDQLTEYIIPLGLLLLYFFVSAGKKGKKTPPQSSKEESRERSPVRKETVPQRVQPPKPQPQRGLSPVRRDEVIGSIQAVEKLNTEVASDLPNQIVSLEMQKYSQGDLELKPPSKKTLSRASLLFKEKGGVRRGILIKEILSPPFE